MSENKFMADDPRTQSDQNDGSQETQQPSLQNQELTDIDALGAKVAELENSVNQLKDQLLRKAAEFENYKKRIESDYATIIKFANEELITRLLPVLDDFERSLKARESALSKDRTTDESAFMRGMELIYSKFKKILETQGIKHFDSVGTPFDPQYHDALMQVQRDDVPPHTVVEEVEKGYMLNDKVIRHARVIVSAEPGNAGPQDGQIQ